MLRSTRYPRLGSKLGISFRSVNPSAGLFIPTWYGTNTKGFSLGGANGSNVADKATFSSETTAATSGANLSVGRGQISTGGNDTFGLTLGGADSSDGMRTTADKTTYSSDTTANSTTAALPVARAGAMGAVSSVNLYSFGGCNPANSNDKAEAYKTPLSTETTAAQTSANLATGRANGSSNSSNTAAMYLGGFRNTPSFFTAQTIADKMPFSTETSANNTSLALPQGRGYTSWPGINGPIATNGFVTGRAAYSLTWCKITYATDTTANSATAAYPSGFEAQGSGISSESTAYTLGGSTTTQVNTAYKMPFSSETVSAVSAMNKSIAKSISAGIS